MTTSCSNIFCAIICKVVNTNKTFTLYISNEVKEIQRELPAKRFLTATDPSIHKRTFLMAANGQLILVTHRLRPPLPSLSTFHTEDRKGLKPTLFLNDSGKHFFADIVYSQNFVFEEKKMRLIWLIWIFSLLPHPLHCGIFIYKAHPTFLVLRVLKSPVRFVLPS